jgi:capsular exopolysaccharide synthesis family protein
MTDSERLPALIRMEQNGDQSVEGASSQTMGRNADRMAGTYGYSMEEAEEAKIPLSQYLWILKRHRFRISGFIAAAVISTLIVSARLTPIFESTATVDIDRQTPPGVVGQDSTRGAQNDADQFLATQIKLVQSDSVLRPVDRRFHLREHELQSMDAARADDAPVVLKRLKVARPPNTYLLLISYRSPDPQLAADASNAIAQSYLEHSYNIRLRSSASLSEFMEKQLDELKAKMERSSQALAGFERDLNVISPEEKTNILSSRLLQLNSEYTSAQGDRLKKEAAFESVRDGSMEAALATPQGESLRHLADHLNEAREQFTEIKTHYGANHPEYRRAAAKVSEIESAIEATRTQIGRRVEVEFRESERRESMVKQALADGKAEFDHMNARSFEYQAVKREAEADKNLYAELIRKIKEAGINAGFQNSSIRIADPARPGLNPVFPSIPLNTMLAFLFSALAAVGAAVISDLLDKTIRDPEQVARTLRTEVIGSLPLMKNRNAAGLGARAIEASSNGASEHQNGVAENGLVTNGVVSNGSEKNGFGKNGVVNNSAVGKSSGKNGVINNRSGKNGVSKNNSGKNAVGKRDERDLSGFGESVRTLRNSILLGNFDRQYRSLLVTSAAPGEGKTTTAANLAAAHAEQGKRTLLIDGDLRRPSVHRNFNLPSAVGLSNALLGEIPWRAAVIEAKGNPGLHILPAGPPSRRASDLIGRGLVELLAEASAEFDLVMLDAPPLLGFAEPLQMATAVDGVIVVARAGQTSRKAVATVLATLNRLRAHVVGVVLNEVHKELSDSYYYYGYYRSYYRPVEEEVHS